MAAHVRDILLAPHLDPAQAASLLEPYGFRDPPAADRNLQAIAADPAARRLLAEILEELLRSLAAAADPDAALNHLERFARSSGSPLPLLSHLRADPRSMGLLALTLGASSFMAEILIRHPAWFYWVSDPDVLARARPRVDIERDLDGALSSLHTEGRQRDLLRITRRREILHIGIRDLLRRSTVPETLAALSGLAEALIQKAYEIAEAGLRRDEGLEPAAHLAGRSSKTGFAVLGLGKLGGGELNFSSDVDLIYVYGSDRGRLGPNSSTRSWSEFYKSLALRLTAALADMSEEGYVYRVDLRLRPEGGAGPLAQSLAACTEYYATRGASWERLALQKAWPVAGDRDLGRRFITRVRPFVYGAAFGPDAFRDVMKMKGDIDRKIATRDESHRNVKLGVGGIREIELVAQALQARHGRESGILRERSTLAALDALAARGHLSTDDRDALGRAYVFLRDVENKLQMVADAQTHSLPESAEDLRRCALRLGYREGPGLGLAEALLRDYATHTAATNRIFRATFERAGALPPS